MTTIESPKTTSSMRLYGSLDYYPPKLLPINRNSIAIVSVRLLNAIYI